MTRPAEVRRLSILTHEGLELLDGLVAADRADMSMPEFLSAMESVCDRLRGLAGVADDPEVVAKADDVRHLLMQVTQAVRSSGSLDAAAATDVLIRGDLERAFDEDDVPRLP